MPAATTRPAPPAEGRLGPDQIRRLRNALGWTVDALAARVGVAKTTLESWMADADTSWGRRPRRRHQDALRRLAAEHGIRLDP